MAKIIVIGAGGVGAVAVQKMAQQNAVFPHITLASRTLDKCHALAKTIAQKQGVRIAVEKLDADDSAQLIALIKKAGAQLVVNLALPYQNLAIMEACLAAGADYLDTANYEPRDKAEFAYHWQWEYHDRFRQAGLMALLGCGFDPGVTNVFTAYAAKHLLDRLETLDIFDGNTGAHGLPFATNFNPEINIREVTAPCRHWENRQWIKTKPLSHKQVFAFPQLGEREVYRLYHEELESLVKHFPTLKRARFWMTFSESYLTHLRVLQNIGMTAIQPILYEGRKIIPLQFLKAVLPEPATLGAQMTGKTCIGTWLSGQKDDQQKNLFIYNICDHAACFAELGAQAVSYTTGVPAMIGAALMVQNIWRKKGVVNMEELDPDPFMAELKRHGLAWQIKEFSEPLAF